MLKRMMSVILACALLAGSCAGLAATATIAYAAGDFAGGDGSAGDPYQIETADQLDKVREYLNDHFVLNNDIDMSVFDEARPWVPIGDGTTPFKGSLDGRNHAIRN